jgi:Flp pilus assembly protein TadB
MCARPTLEKAFGKRSLMGSALRSAEKSLSAQEPLSDVAVDLCYRLDYIELLPVMHALSITRVVGTGVISILKNSCQMMSELIAVKSEVEANNAGKNAEAFLLCLMPFGITYALSSFTGDYLAMARSEPMGIALMLLAFCIAIISCGFLFSMISEKNRNDASAGATEGFSLPLFLSKFSGAFRERVSLLLPQGYITGVYGLLSELSYRPDLLFEFLLLKSLCVTLFMLPLSAMILRMLRYPIILALPLVVISIILIHHDLRSRVLRRREGIMEEIPLFLSMLVTLLQSGVLLPKAIETCSSAFPESGVMGSELRIMNAQMLAGTSAGRAVELFSERTPVPEAQSALLLASRFEVTGGSEVLGLLSLQATACWSLCRNASRKKREREALAMILPMMLDFISVLLVATTPALISLQLS